MSRNTAACPRPDVLMAVDEGVLPESVVQQVRQHLSSCSLCVQLRRDLLESSLAEPTLAEVERVRERVLGRGAVKRARMLGYVAAAAVAVAIVAGVYVAPRNAPADLSKTAAPQYRLPLAPAPLRLPLNAALVLRGNASKVDERYLTELGVALDPYRASRYMEAIPRLSSLADKYPAAVEPPFYLGVARLLAGDAAGSIASLERARTIGGEALNDDIAWYLAIARERTGTWQAATKFLEPLCAGDGVYRAAACKALGRQ